MECKRMGAGLLISLFCGSLTQVHGSRPEVKRGLLQSTPTGGAVVGPPECPGNNYLSTNPGDTLTDIAIGMGGNGCMSQQLYLSQLHSLNPQVADVNDALIPGDEICFPRQNGNYGRRRILQLRYISPNRNHPAPPDCPPQQIGYAERGDTLGKVAEAFHCLRPGSPSLTSLLQRLRDLNPGLPSADSVLPQGTRVCVAI
eukprot:jgi/Botrbrau1/522/Bobra.110_2s0150.1